MSRAHERTYRLLAERVRLTPKPRRALYATVCALFGTGVWWLFVHYGGSDELPRLAQEALALKVHGAASFAMLIAVGAMSANHVRRGWGLNRNRASGSVVIAVFVVLIASGYALYYLVDDETRPAISLLHWLPGLGLAPLLIVHVIAGRRSRHWRHDADEPRQVRH